MISWSIFQRRWISTVPLTGSNWKKRFKNLVKPDRYGSGGAVEELKKNGRCYRKRKAIYMFSSGQWPTNLPLLYWSGENKKYLFGIPAMYRDEADAAQSVYNKGRCRWQKRNLFYSRPVKKRLITWARKKYSKSGIGCVSIENPVRRTDERMVAAGGDKRSALTAAVIISSCISMVRDCILPVPGQECLWKNTLYFDTVYFSL